MTKLSSIIFRREQLLFWQLAVNENDLSVN